LKIRKEDIHTRKKYRAVALSFWWISIVDIVEVHPELVVLTAKPVAPVYRENVLVSNGE